MPDAWRRSIPRRWLLWGIMCVLVGLLLAALVFLAREYEEGLALERQQRRATEAATDVRSGLLRNLQNLLALHSVAYNEDAWGEAAYQMLSSHREIVHLEWLDVQLQPRVARVSLYRPGLFSLRQRRDARLEVVQACTAARRNNGAAYAPSYFWPLAQGTGIELMEMCLPVTRDGQPDGFLVATYALGALLTELVPPEVRRGQRLAWTEADGTRLTIIGDLPPGSDVIHAQQLFDLPGVAYVIRAEGPREVRGWFPHVLTAAVAALAVALTGVLALFARDLRRRQRAESRLADALAFRKAMEDSLVTGLRARDMEGRITYVNPAFCQMVGLAPHQLLGTGVPAPYWPPEQFDEYRQRMAVRLAGRVMPREGYESEFIRSDGTRFPVLIIEAPLIDARGVQTGWMSAVLDLSEQRRSEEMSRASQERLQATARLAMAGEMASLISHELNQPLAAIASYATGSLNLLDEPADAPPGSGWRQDVTLALRRIAEQAERAGKVIKSVGDLVRQRERAREAVPVPALFEAIAPLLQLQGRKLDIALDMEVSEPCPPVWCDRTMVEQVLLNLARNGMQAMPIGEPRVGSGLRRLSLRAAVVRAPGREGLPQWVEFQVADHGHGLTPEQAERLFTPFFTTKPEGMGLGLNLCRTVVEQHGGALRFEPRQPRGTVFIFTLPAAAL